MTLEMEEIRLDAGNKIAIVRLEGGVAKGPENNQLHNELRKLIRKGHKLFIIDLTHVKRAGDIFTTELSIARANGVSIIRLVGAPASTLASLEKAHLSQNYQNFATKEDALRSFDSVPT
jgi:hypothetical protein